MFFVILFRAIIAYALPCWLLYLPFVVSLKVTEPWKAVMFLISGMVTGPMLLALFGATLQLKGGNVHSIWWGDGIDVGLVPCMFIAAIVGFLTTSIYVFGLQMVAKKNTDNR